ncbi:biotin transporter BioY [Anaeromicropila populeti]|uniref:Biotin transporter n=1 Tax=Anaeromicropila populeti TaxID=37658 RepID=A0A1I6JWT6_9FIRM|nr:biotin transporter BioY [Anaeromicropila populeti]SFR83413.1 biotin transport system substrate-specific component [Anaeromicropila populeti]
MKEKTFLKTNELILCALFAALIAAGAFIKIPIPVVPFTLQFLFTNLAGMLLGKKSGSISVAVYLLIGLLGIPVFTNGGGPGYIVQPTFGYLIGFLAGSFAAGYVVEKGKTNRLSKWIMAGLLNLIIVYTMGMLYYYIISNYYIHSQIGVKALFLYCFVLAVPGDLLLCIISAMIGKRISDMTNGGLLRC